MTTTVIIKANHWDVKVTHIDVHAAGHETKASEQTVKLGTEAMVHIWEGRDIRIHEIKKETSE